jgi:EAL domain-containing protein (putative c-di-GMP-specific phosphodiesterase class I)
MTVSASRMGLLRTRRRLEEELRGAAEAGQLFSLYQPMVDTVSREPKGYEALLRWRHPTYGVLPRLFIGVAEESGSIVEIGAWVLEEACRQAALWNDNLFLAVNVSARQLITTELLGHVTAALEANGLDPERLELEITETSLLEDRADVASRLKALKALGVKLVMDDYGSSYSSTTNLRCYPFDKIKIDRSYVAALEEDPLAEVIIDCALALGKSLGLTVVVEGIETEAQRARLVDKAPDQLQGFLLGRPEPEGGKRSGLLESVRKVIHFEQSLRSMRRIDAILRKASALRERFSKSLASLRHRPSHANVRSTTQRLGRTSKPLAVSDRLTISVTKPGIAFFCALAKTGP